MTEKTLKKADKILQYIYTLFLAFLFFRYFSAILAFLSFALPFSIACYGILFLIYIIPHFFRDLSSSYTAEDMAEQRLDEEEVTFERADHAIIEFWEYNVHWNFPFEYWRGNYWMEEIEEQWDWLQRRAFDLRRYPPSMMFLWKHYDWYEQLPNTVRNLPVAAFPDFWIDDSTYYHDEKMYKKVILMAEEHIYWEERSKGLHNPLTVERHNYFKRWWREGLRINKFLGARKGLHDAIFPKLQEGIPDLHVVEEGQRERSTSINDNVYFLTPGGVNLGILADVKKYEDLLMNDDDWEIQDE